MPESASGLVLSVVENLHGYFCYAAFDTSPVRTVDFVCFTATAADALVAFKAWIASFYGNVPDDTIYTVRDITAITRHAG